MYIIFYHIYNKDLKISLRLHINLGYNKLK